MLKVAVLGSEGFIGKHLVEELNKINNINVYSFGKDTFSRHSHGNYNQISLKDSKKNKNLLKSIDIVYYLISSTFPFSSFDDPLIDVNSNLSPFLHFMESINNLNVKKLIFVSSGGSIYGASENVISEDSLKLPISPHGIIKLTMEYYLEYFKLKNKINYDIIRVSNVYGEGQNTSKGLGLINTILEKIRDNQEIHIYGDGTSLRNYIYVKDVAKALTFSVNSNLSVSNTFNLASDDTLCINDILKIIRKKHKKDLNVKFLPARESDIHKIRINNKKFLSTYPDFKFIEISEGIKKTYDHLI